MDLSRRMYRKRDHYTSQSETLCEMPTECGFESYLKKFLRMADASISSKGCHSPCRECYS